MLKKRKWRKMGIKKLIGQDYSRVKTEINWIEYDIDWVAMVKKSCKHCYSRGFEGFEVNKDGTRDILLCRCVSNRWTKMTDEERMTYAIKKENAEEVVAKAKEEVQKAIEANRSPLSAFP